LRIAGLFKGDVHVGSLTIELGGRLIGGVRAKSVVIAGTLEGGIESATRVAVLATGVLKGDLQAGMLVVEAGSDCAAELNSDSDEAAWSCTAIGDPRSFTQRC